MSETTPGETPVERRLREMVDERQSYPDDVRALEAGREALALLREWRFGPVQSCARMAEYIEAITAIERKVDALLARCEGDR